MERQTVTVKGKPLEVVKIDVAWMKENYELFRQEYFSNLDMPPVEEMRFKVEVGRHKNWWGYAQYDGPSWIRIRAGEVWHPGSGESINRVTPEAMRAMGFESDTLERKYVARNVQSWVPSYPARYSSFTIALNNEEFLPEVLFEGTLVHEMVHIATMRNRLWDGGKSNAHDGWFKKIGEYITRASGGRYEIQRYVTRYEVGMKNDINYAMSDVGKGCLVRFVLTDSIGTRSWRNFEDAINLYYSLESPDEAKAFVDSVKRNVGVIDYSRFRHLHPFMGRHGKRLDARIMRAEIYSMDREAVDEPKRVYLLNGEERFLGHRSEKGQDGLERLYALVGSNFVQWVGKKAIEVDGTTPVSPITDNWIKAWYDNGHGSIRRHNAMMRVMVGSGFLKPIDVVQFMGEEEVRGLVGNGHTADEVAPPQIEKQPEPIAQRPKSEIDRENFPFFHIGDDPKEHIRKMYPGARKAFYSQFFEWYHGMQEWDREEVEAWKEKNAQALGGMDDNSVLLSYFLHHNAPNDWLSHWDDPVEAKESVLLPCDYSDEDRMAMITEGMLGDMFRSAGRAVKGAVREVGNWLSRLVDRVRASVWNDEVDVQEHGDGTVTITMT